MQEQTTPDRKPAQQRNQATAWPWGPALLVLALTTAPYLWAAAHANEDWTFTGFLFAVDDGLSYIAKMRLGAQGAWLFRTPYTTRPTVGLPAFTAYLALGHLLHPRAEYAAFVLLFHAFRLAALLGLVHALHRVLTWLLPAHPRWRTAVLLWTTLGGGLGWLPYALGRGAWVGWAPLSFHSPEAFGFLAVWGLPHLTAARALWLYALWAYAHDRPRRALAAALALLAFQPLYIVPLALLWLALLRPKPQRVVPLVLASLAWSAYWAYMLWARFTDPIVQAWDAQNNVRLVPWPALLLAYGPWLPWVGVGWNRLRARAPRPARALAFWLLAVAGLMLVPTSVQRRLLEGVWWAWGLLVAHAMGANRARIWRLAPWALAAVSPALLLAAAWHAAARPGPPLFRARAEAQAMHAWAQQAPLGAGILAAYPTSTTLPAWAPVRAPLGHPVESPGWEQKRAALRTFFAPRTPDDQRRAWLRQLRVQWLWWGPTERGLGSWDPRNAPYLEPAFRQGPYWVFRVRP